MVGDQPVYQTPSTNLAIAFKELDKLPHTPEVEKVQAHIIAAQVQVNEFQNDSPSYSTASARSRCSCRDGGGQISDVEGPRPQARGPYLYRGTRGNYEAHSRHDACPPCPLGGQGGNHN